MKNTRALTLLFLFLMFGSMTAEATKPALPGVGDLAVRLER